VFKIEYQGQHAAVKEFHKHMHDMLRRELKTLQLLAHPNIVRVMAIITDAASQPLGFVMEYVPLSLDAAMHRMTLQQAVHVLSEAALGLAVAHDAHVIVQPGGSVYLHSATQWSTGGELRDAMGGADTAAAVNINTVSPNAAQRSARR
jgi:serine/threonine protein kinase